MNRAWVILAFTLACAASTTTRAESAPGVAGDVATVSDSAQPAGRREGRAQFFDPADQQLDLSSFLEHPRAFLPIPIVVTEPAVGYGGGAAGMFLRPREEAGDEGWSRPDVSAVGAFGTQNGTWGAFAGDSTHWADGRVKTLAGVAGGQVNLDFYGLGRDGAPFDGAISYSLQFVAAIAQASWQVAHKSPWWLGVRFVYADVDPKPRDASRFPGLTDSVRVKVSAPTAVVEFDTRDNLFTPTHGIYAESSYLISRQALGASTDFERFQQVLTGWQPLADSVTAGVRGDYAWSSATTPFFLRPYIVLRGVPAVRYQGDEMASLEMEGRWQFHGRWSAVAFGGAGTARTTRGRSPSSESVASGGVGFRYELARKFGMHAGIDLAHSPGTTAVYLQVGNAWFRP